MISIFAEYLIIRKSLLIISDEFEIFTSILPSGYCCCWYDYLYHSQFVDSQTEIGRPLIAYPRSQG